MWARPDQPRFLHSYMRLGRRLPAILLGLGRLRMRQRGLRGVADGLSQHLAELGLGLCRLARRRFPLSHNNYMGRPEGN
jgi:hypothetical protein